MPLLLSGAAGLRFCWFWPQLPSAPACLPVTFRKQNLEKQTQAFVARGELQSGVLVARRLLALDENNLVANRAMAEMAEQVGRPEALTWRQKLAHLAPQDTAYQLALARTALRFGHFEVGRSALHQLPAAARDTVEFYQVAGAEALALRQFPRAESHFAAALKLAPDNASIAFNLAALRLASGDPQVAETARVSIRQLAQNPSVRREALRAIIADAITRNDRVTARECAEQLMQLDGAPFSDALLCFEAFHGTDAAASTLAQLQERAATSPTSAAELIAWHNRHGEALVALEWSARLPREVAEAHPVPLAIAESVQLPPGLERLAGTCRR